MTQNRWLFLVALALCSLNSNADPAQHIEEAIRAGGRASGNATASAGHSLAASGQIASGAVALPVLASGVVAVGVGSAAIQSGAASLNAATRPIGQPLPITSETISVLPPNQALQKQNTPN